MCEAEEDIGQCNISLESLHCFVNLVWVGNHVANINFIVPIH